MTASTIIDVQPAPTDPKDAPPTLRHAPPEGAGLLDYAGDAFTAKYPEGWEVTGKGDSVTFTPPSGGEKDSEDDSAFARGVLVSIVQPQSPVQDGSSASATAPPSTPPATDLGAATDQLIASLKSSSPHLKATGAREAFQVDGQPAISIKLSSDSPLGGFETDWLVVVVRPQGVLYFICAAPASEYDDYDATFQKIISSVRLNH
jgi:hypothetical protein